MRLSAVPFRLKRRLMMLDRRRATRCNDLACKCATCRVDDCPCAEAHTVHEREMRALRLARRNGRAA